MRDAGTRDDPLRDRRSPPSGGVGSRVESELASLTGRRNWPREGRQPVRDAGGFGPRPARGGGGQIRPNSERVPHGFASLTGQPREGRVLRRIFVGSLSEVAYYAKA